MKAAVIHEHGGPGTIRIERNFPDPQCGPDDVIMRVRATSINYHDIFTRRGMPGVKVPMPCIMGMDFAGDLVRVGANVRDWRVGDRVVVDPVDRQNYGGLIGEMWHGGLAELCGLPAHHLVRLPDEVSYRDAATLPVAYGTARRMMLTIGGTKKGDKVLILGASGGVGTSCLLLAKMVGAEVTVCASTSEKLDRLRQLGADNLINYSTEDFVKEIYRLYGKPHRRKYTEGVDIVVNFTGGNTWVPSLKVLHRNGKVLTCGATAGFDPKEDLRYIWSYELQVLGSNGWLREDVHELIDYTASGKLNPLIDHEFPLEKVNEAFRLMEERRVFGKIVIIP